MKQPEEAAEEESEICFGLIRYRSGGQPRPLSTDNVLERLRKLIRAQYLQIASYEHDVQEERLLAKMYLERKPTPDMDAARTHARLALMHQETRKKELVKYENLVRLVAQMEEARRNLGMAHSMVESRDLLQSLTLETDRLNIDEVTDALREYLDQVRDHSGALSEPLLPPQDEEEVNKELDQLMELHHPLPSVVAASKPKVKKNVAAAAAEK